MNKKIIIGLSGKIGGGKSFISKFLVDKHNFKSVSFGKMIAQTLIDENKDVTRKAQQERGQELINNLGHNGLSKLLLDKYNIIDSPSNFVIDGIRHKEVHSYFKNTLGELLYKLLYIDVPLEIRYNRTLLRKKNDKIITLNDFKKVQGREVEQGIDELKDLADYILDNSKTTSETHQNLDSFISTFIF